MGYRHGLCRERYSMAEEIRNEQVYKKGVLSFECYDRDIRIQVKAFMNKDKKKVIAELTSEGIIRLLNIQELIPKYVVEQGLRGKGMYAEAEKIMLTYFKRNDTFSVEIDAASHVRIQVEKKTNCDGENYVYLYTYIDGKQHAVMYFSLDRYIKDMQKREYYRIGKNLVSAVMSAKPFIFRSDRVSGRAAIPHKGVI
jgi:hypothetical protein